MLPWFRKAIPAVPPLFDYWITVLVRLEPPLETSDGTRAVGYFRLLGLRTTPDSVREMIRGCVTDGVVVWDKTEIKTVDVRQMDRRLTKQLRRACGAAAWHESGHIFFESWDDDETTQ